MALKARQIVIDVMNQEIAANRRGEPAKLISELRDQIVQQIESECIEMDEAKFHRESDPTKYPNWKDEPVLDQPTINRAFNKALL